MGGASLQAHHTASYELMYWVGCAKEHTHQPPWGMEMCQGAGWDMESHEQLALGSCCPSTSRGRGSHTQGSKLWSAQRAMVVGCTQPTTRQADTHQREHQTRGTGPGAHRTQIWVRQQNRGGGVVCESGERPGRPVTGAQAAILMAELYLDLGFITQAELGSSATLC